MTKRSASRSFNRTLLSCALGSALLLSAPLALAQATGATLRGQVSADSAPAADARVTATNTATGLSRSVQASANGSYSLAGLPPGTYRVDVTANGQTSSRTVTLQVGQTATLDLGVGGVAETGPQEATDMDAVVVTAQSLVETRTSEVATYVTQKQIEALPQGTRNFLAFADTVPGIKFEQDAGGNTRLRSGAQNASAVNVFIDGVGQKSYTLPGGISGQDSSRGNPFPQSAIGEYKVITQNYKAEFDQISSAAIVAATRSGTNEFEGSFFWDRTSSDWRAMTPAEQNDGEKVESKEEQYGASFAGPLIRDKLHFFVAYEAKEYINPRLAELRSQGRYDVADVPADLLAQLGPTNSPFDQDMYFGKLSWSINDANFLELSAQVREEEEIIGVGAENLPERATNNVNDVKRYDLRWQYSDGRWLNDMHVTYEDTSWAPQGVIGAPGYLLRVADLSEPGRRLDVGTILNAGGSSNSQNKGQEGWGFQNDLTFFGWEGHTLKMGVKYKDVEVNAIERHFANPQFYYDIGVSTEQPYLVEFGSGIPGTSEGFTTSKNKQFGIYVQDDWEVNDRLTLNFGVRWDYEKTPNYLDHVTPPELVEALREWPAMQGPNIDYDIEDYISTGNNRSAFKGAWQPRLGFSYDVNADQSFVVFGGAGRAYDRNLFDYLQVETNRTSYARFRANFIEADGQCRDEAGCIPWDPAYFDPAVLRQLAQTLSTGREWYLNNNDLKVPYSDQFSLGVRNVFGMLGAEWNSEITVSHVRSKDGFVFRLGNRRPDGSFFENPGDVSGAPWGFPSPVGTILLADNMLETKTNSLFLKLDKPYTEESGWSATFAYTYADAEQNSPATGWPEIFGRPDTSWFGWLPARELPQHRFVATGIWDGPWGVTFSGKLTLESPERRVSEDCRTSSTQCVWRSWKPDETIGLKQFDVAATKTWDTGTDLSFYVRADVLNVFNWHNWTSYNDSWTSDEFQERYLDIAWPPRSFKLSFGVNW
ncbi:TonB-dependent receptor [Luteimonas huabeiensis]|uniref:TonB-dependent receptor n=1 Tax=Luteimonas huabeiensis TaxID=1244513 RepID=UPI0004B8AACF|nr:TonB-dependent receptor [Luteimonas huabeiensis]